MTELRFLTDPVVRDRDDRLDYGTVRLADTHLLLEVTLHTPAGAHALADAFRAVAHHLEEARRAEGARLDRDAARGMGRPDGPVLQLSQTPAVSRVVSIPVKACECSRVAFCDEHGGGAA